MFAYPPKPLFHYILIQDSGGTGDSNPCCAVLVYTQYVSQSAHSGSHLSSSHLTCQTKYLRRVFLLTAASRCRRAFVLRLYEFYRCKWVGWCLEWSVDPLLFYVTCDCQLPHSTLCLRSTGSDHGPLSVQLNNITCSALFAMRLVPL